MQQPGNPHKDGHEHMRIIAGSVYRELYKAGYVYADVARFTREFELLVSLERMDVSDAAE